MVSIRARLLVLVLIPAVALAALTAQRLSDVRRLARLTVQFETFIDIANDQFAVMHALQVERTRTLEALVGLGDMGAADVQAAREATDAARAALVDTVDEAFVGQVSPEALAAYTAAREAADGVGDLRDRADAGQVSPADVRAGYALPVQAILDFDDAVAPLVYHPLVLSRLQVSAAFARLQATVLDRLDLVLLATAGATDRAAAVRDVGALASQQVLWQEIIGRLATDEEVARLAELATIDPAAEVDRVGGGLAAGTLPPVQVQAADARATADELRALEVDFAEASVVAAADLRSQARRGLAVLGGIALAVLLFTLLLLATVDRRIIRPLRRLTAIARHLDGSLSRTVQRVAAGEEDSPPDEFALAADKALLDRRDEIGDLAKAFKASTDQAVGVALDQARTRDGVAKTIADVARREQSLVEQQLALLDRLEDAEANPEQLANLFGLDHLATRMRRNAENLLLLSTGQLPGGPTDPAAALVDVVRGAAAETEEYQRVDVAVATAGHIAGYAGTPVSHLLAELVENATAFSPPTTRVRVTSEALPHGGVRVRIADRGIGMTPEELAAAREKLARPPLLEAAESRRLGLYVVGLIAARLGIVVAVDAGPGGGTVVDVDLPASLLVDAPAAEPPAVAAPALAPPVPALVGARSPAAEDPAPDTTSDVASFGSFFAAPPRPAAEEAWHMPPPPPPSGRAAEHVPPVPQP